jgi:hypothetical protein
LWIPNSSLQSAALFAANHAPNGYAAPLTHFAIRTYQEGTDDPEAVNAATLLQGDGAREDAAVLWLGLAQRSNDAGKLSEAKRYATNAYNAHPTVEALLTLVALTRDSPKEQSAWIAALRSRFPNHPVSHAYECTQGIVSLDRDPPAICNAEPWVWEPTQTKHKQYQQLSSEIDNLPTTAAAEIATARSRIAALDRDQSVLLARYFALKTEVEKLEGSAFFRVLAKTLLSFLPMCEEGEPFLQCIIREGLCTLEGARLGCAGIAGLKEYAAYRYDLELAISRRDSTLEDWARNGSILTDYWQSVAYWESGKPLAERIAARDRILPALKDDVVAHIRANYGTIGIPFSEAIALASS